MMKLTLTDKKVVEVKSFEEASRLVRAEIDADDMGGTEWYGHRNVGKIADASGSFIAHVSYNGRVWRGETSPLHMEHAVEIPLLMALAATVKDIASAEAAIVSMFERFGGWHPDDPASEILWEAPPDTRERPAEVDLPLIDAVMERCFEVLGDGIYTVASRAAGLTESGFEKEGV